MKRMLVSDIDGTLLKDGRTTDGLDVLRRVLSVQRDEVALVYATGRSFASVWDLVQRGVLPEPDAVAPFIGTEVWFKGWQAPDGDHRSMVEQDWDRGAVMGLISSLPGMMLQEDEFQSELKASFLLDKGATVYSIQRLLDGAGLEARVIYSCGKYLDILPRRAGKSGAVEFLRQMWQIPSHQVLTCGDSGNDLDMLMDPSTMGVAVGNAEQEIRMVPSFDSFYKAVLPFASGVLEGAAVFGFWPGRRAIPQMARG